MESHPSRKEDLEDVVDELEQDVADEHPDDNLPIGESEGEQPPADAAVQEPPD